MRVLWLMALLVFWAGGAAAAEWQVSRSVDRMDDTERVVAYVHAPDGYLNTIGMRSEASLYVRCWDEQLDTFVALDSFLIPGEVSVRVRFDEEMPEQVRTSVASNHQAIFLRGGRDLIGKLMNFNVALVEVRAGGHRHLIEFPLRGSARAIGEVLRACGHGPREPAESRSEDLRTPLDRQDASRARVRFVNVWGQQVREAWSRPTGAAPGLSADVRVNVLPSGDVAEIEIVRSSGDTAFDRSVENAIRRASPLQVPEDEDEFSERGLYGVTFRFAPSP